MQLKTMQIETEGNLPAIPEEWQEQESQEIQDYVSTYSQMKPKEAAAIFDTMTDNLELVAKILDEMDTQSAANILGKMDSETAAKVTELMEPEE